MSGHWSRRHKTLTSKKILLTMRARYFLAYILSALALLDSHAAFSLPKDTAAAPKLRASSLAPTPSKRKLVSPRWMQVSRGGASNSPTLSQWIGPALSSALSYASYNIAIKLGSSSISPLLGGVVLQAVAALLGTLLLGLSNEKLVYDRKGIMYSCLAGVAVGAAELLSFKVSGMGVEASRSVPVMIGGSVVFGAIMGYALLKERMSIKGWFGVLLVVLGIACVATDPGAKLASH